MKHGPDSPYRTAFHEAGHLVAHLIWNGRRPIFATIIPSPRRKFLGHVVVYVRSTSWLRTTKRTDRGRAFVIAHRRIRGAMAGFAAESIACGLHPRNVSPHCYRGTDDLDIAIETIRAVYTPKASKAHVEGMVAWILLSEYRRVRAALKKNWPFVRRVARELLRVKTLKSRDLRAIYRIIESQLVIPVYRIGPWKDDARLPA